MEILKLIAFLIAITVTLDYLTDVIEIMSGRSSDHKKLKETEPDLWYMAVVVLAWGFNYVIQIIA